MVPETFAFAFEVIQRDGIKQQAVDTLFRPSINWKEDKYIDGEVPVLTSPTTGS